MNGSVNRIYVRMHNICTEQQKIKVCFTKNLTRFLNYTDIYAVN